MPILFDFWVSSTQTDSQLNQVVSVIMTYTFFPSFQYLRCYLIFFSETQLFFSLPPQKNSGWRNPTFLYSSLFASLHYFIFHSYFYPKISCIWACAHCVPKFYSIRNFEIGGTLTLRKWVYVASSSVRCCCWEKSEQCLEIFVKRPPFVLWAPLCPTVPWP